MQKSCNIKNQTIVENGDVVLLKKNDCKVIDSVVSGRLLLKGNKLFSIKDDFLKNLKIVAKDGEFFINLILDLNNNLILEPIVFCPTVSDNPLFIQNIKLLISKEIKNIKTNLYLMK